MIIKLRLEKDADICIFCPLLSANRKNKSILGKISKVRKLISMVRANHRAQKVRKQYQSPLTND